MNRVHDWTDDEDNNIDIEAERMDEDTDDIADEITNSIAADGQTNPTANLPMDGFKHTGVGNASARDEYAVVGQIQAESYKWCGTSGGTANAQTLTPSPTITAYAAGQKFGFLPVATNTSGTVTIANSGLTARNVKKSIGGAKVILAVGDIIIGIPAEVRDDGTDYILMNPQKYTHGADIASATTTNLDTATGDLVDVTGTTTITAITLSEGRCCTVRFTGALTLTNGASLVLPGGANITTIAGDMAVFRGYASGVVRCVSYQQNSSIQSTGSWTPVLTAATPGNLNVVYSLQVGGYIKIGKLVIANFSIQTSTFTHTTASGNVQITGLPFQSDWGASQGTRGMLQGSGWTKANYTQMMAVVSNGASIISVEMTGSAQTLANLAITECPSGTQQQFRGCLTYRTDS
jgi:hypothetical protein